MVSGQPTAVNGHTLAERCVSKFNLDFESC